MVMGTGFFMPRTSRDDASTQPTRPQLTGSQSQSEFKAGNAARSAGPSQGSQQHGSSSHQALDNHKPSHMSNAVPWKAQSSSSHRSGHFTGHQAYNHPQLPTSTSGPQQSVQQQPAALLTPSRRSYPGSSINASSTSIDASGVRVPSNRVLQGTHSQPGSSSLLPGSYQEQQQQLMLPHDSDNVVSSQQLFGTSCSSQDSFMVLPTFGENKNVTPASARTATSTGSAFCSGTVVPQALGASSTSSSGSRPRSVVPQFPATSLMHRSPTAGAGAGTASTLQIQNMGSVRQGSTGSAVQGSPGGGLQGIQAGYVQGLGARGVQGSVVSQANVQGRDASTSSMLQHGAAFHGLRHEAMPSTTSSSVSKNTAALLQRIPPPPPPRQTMELVGLSSSRQPQWVAGNWTGHQQQQQQQQQQQLLGAPGDGNATSRQQQQVAYVVTGGSPPQPQQWIPIAVARSSGQQQWAPVMTCTDSNTSMGNIVQHLHTDVAPSARAVVAGTQLAPPAVAYMQPNQLPGLSTAPLAASPAAAGAGSMPSSLLAEASPVLAHADSELLLAHLQLRQLQREQQQQRQQQQHLGQDYHQQQQQYQQQYQPQYQQQQLLLAQPSTSVSSAALNGAAPYGGSLGGFADLCMQNAVVSQGSFSASLLPPAGSFTWQEHDLRPVASLSVPVNVPSLPSMPSGPTSAAAAAVVGSVSSAMVGGSLDASNQLLSGPQLDFVASHDSSSGSVAVLAAAAAQGMLEQMQQLKGMQQQLMDEVIALLPLM